MLLVVGRVRRTLSRVFTVILLLKWKWKKKNRNLKISYSNNYVIGYVSKIKIIHFDDTWRKEKKQRLSRYQFTSFSRSPYVCPRGSLNRLSFQLNIQPVPKFLSTIHSSHLIPLLNCDLQLAHYRLSFMKFWIKELFVKTSLNDSWDFYDTIRASFLSTYFFAIVIVKQ